MTPFALVNVTTAAAAVREPRPGAPADGGPLAFARLNEQRPLTDGTDVRNEIKDGLIARECYRTPEIF